jgi:pyruvate kinase
VQTKIICTIGPASRSKTKIKKMIRAGMNVARINFSHGTQKSNGELIDNIRLAACESKKNIGIMADLQGPRIRIANVQDSILLKQGEIVFLREKYTGDLEKKGKKNIGIDKANLLKYLKKGDLVYLDNGMLELIILSKSLGKAKCKVQTGGELKSRKGVNISRISSRLGSLTTEDKSNLKFALGKDVDFIAMSFVKTARDIIRLSKLIKKMMPGIKSNRLPLIVAKIETQEAITNFDKILKVADAILIARGDLALELPLEQIPVLQKEMIKKCLHNARPVIVATQMLESMMENPRPTRAEITDVANAVIDNTDSLTLSGETAMGKYPVKVVRTMSKIIRYTEAGPYNDLDYSKFLIKELIPIAFIAQTATTLARQTKTNNIIIRNAPLAVIYEVSRFRPEINIWYFTKSRYIARRISLVWGARTISNLKKIKGGYILINGVPAGNGKIECNIEKGE